MALFKCPDCGKDVSDAAPSCPNCGRPILQSSTAPEQTSPATEVKEAPKLSSFKAPKPPSFKPAIIAAVILIVLVLYVISKNTPPDPNKGELTAELASNLLCSKSLGDLDMVGRVRQAGDVKGVWGLVSRSKAMVVPAGTTVHVVQHSAERASIFVRSGAQIGEDCWAKPGWIDFGPP